MVMMVRNYDRKIQFPLLPDHYRRRRRRPFWGRGSHGGKKCVNARLSTRLIHYSSSLTTSGFWTQGEGVSAAILELSVTQSHRLVEQFGLLRIS